MFLRGNKGGFVSSSRSNLLEFRSDSVTADNSSRCPRCVLFRIQLACIDCSKNYILCWALGSKKLEARGNLLQRCLFACIGNDF